MDVKRLATYQPAWLEQPTGYRVTGPDEDVLTLAVAAATALEHLDDVERIDVVTSQPDTVEGFAETAIPLALGLAAETPVALRVGGAPAALEALTTAPVGSLVIAVEVGPPAGSAAAVVGEAGARLTPHPRAGARLPMRVRALGDPAPAVYDDPRFLRDRGHLPTIVALLGDDDSGPVVAAGFDARLLERAKVRAAPPPLDDIPVKGAAAGLFAVAAMLEAKASGRVLAMEDGTGLVVNVESADSVTPSRVCRAGTPHVPRSRDDTEIAVSLPAYERAFAAKVGMTAARCGCGAISFPPRIHCADCGDAGDKVPLPLPRAGTVYSCVTVHVPVPGLLHPYALGIIELQGLPVRVLAHVTDCLPDSVTIGDEGDLVLRRVAIREGVPDYGYAFRPAEKAGQEVAA